MSAAEVLRQQARTILVRWESLVRAAAPRTDTPLLADTAPAFIDHLAARLEDAKPAAAVRPAPPHGPLEQLIAEYGLLRQAAIEQLHGHQTLHELQLLLKAFDDAVAEASCRVAERQARALRRTERLFHSLVDAVRDHAIFTVDAGGRIVQWNSGAERIEGYTEQEIVGRHVSELYAPQDREAGLAEQHLVQAAREGRCEGEGTRLRKDGSTFLAHFVLTALNDAAGRVTGFSMVTRDVSHYKALERALRERTEALQKEGTAKDEFLAMLAHELRNPLSAIRSSVELIRLRGGKDESTQRPRQIIERQVLHLTHQVDDLLDVARLSRGTLRLRKQRADLGALARHAVETVQAHTAQRGQHVNVSVARDPVWVDADPTRISQCIGNLLHNASKFTEPGREIELQVMTEDGEALVRVRDPGAGIEPDVLPHVFDLYAHGVRWVNGTQSGLGLGLKLVRSLVEMHGGRVEAHSGGVGRGAEFVIRLPLRERRKARAAAPAPAQAEPAHGLRVLVVDDNVDAASSLAEVLAIWGHEVVEVHDGSSALRAAAAQPPDVVILDLSMPDMDGHEVARRLNQHPQRSRMRVVALSGYGQAQDRARTAQEGFDDHLVKPVDFAGLERYLSEYSAPRGMPH